MNNVLYWKAEAGYIQGEDGKMRGSYPSAGKRKAKQKYATSPRASHKGLTVSHKEFGLLRGQLNTRYPNAKPEDGQLSLYTDRYKYYVTADGYGSLIINSRHKIKK